MGFGSGPVNPLAAAELETQPWRRLRTMIGTAEDVPDALAALECATDEKAADRAYWRLDNRVVVQGQLFESAFGVVQVLLAMLIGSLSLPAKRRVVDLLLQIAGGVPDATELAVGDLDLAERCRESLRAATWKLYELTLDNDFRVRQAALELVAQVDQDHQRLKRALLAISESDPHLSDFAVDLLADVPANEH